MYPPTRGSAGAAGEAVFDVDEARGAACRHLAAAAAGLAWALNVLLLLVTEDATVVEEAFLLSLVVAAAAGLSWVSLRRNVRLAGICLAAGLAVAIGVVVLPHPNGPATGLLALVVIAAAATAGPRAGLAWAGITSAIVLFATDRLGLAPSDGTAAALALVWGSAFISWLGFRPVAIAADRAWQNLHDARRLMEELRVERAKLVQLSKSLNHAYARLERQNALLERARAAAEEARRQKADFAAAISHELRTPVNLIVGVSELLVQPPGRQNGGAPDQFAEDVDVIYRNGCHISHLIDDVLELSQVDANRLGLNKQPVRVVEVIEQAASVVARQFQRKGLYLRLETPDDLPAVTADPVRVRQVLLNLLTNAARFTDFGGITLRAVRQERDVVVSVADTGTGIPAAELATVFEAFRQVGQLTRQGRREGSGLGLTVSKRLVEAHGGSMWVESAPDQGTTFYFSLPLTDSVVTRPLNRDLDTETHGGGEGPGAVVLVGSDARAARVIARHLDGFRVLVAEGPEQLRRTVRRQEVEALLFTDGGGAPTPARAGVPPGALSMSCSLRTERALAQETGAAAYLVKPVTKEQLESALRGLGRRLGSVLVVEDDPEMGRLLARMVRSGARRRRVRSASDGAEALRLVREAPPDVVLLDLLMPGTDGYEFLSALRRDERLRDLPVVVVTAKGRGSDAIVADALTVTRPGGLAIGELTRLVRACVNAGGRWTSLEDERPATTLSA